MSLIWGFEMGWVLYESERERVREEERAARFFGGKNGETPDPHYED